MFLSAMVWIILGLVAGLIAGKVVNRRGQSMPVDVGFGILGAVIGGGLFTSSGAADATGFNIWSLLIAVVGAVVMLGAWHLVRGPGLAGMR